MEKIYYIVVNNAQEGPLSKEELRFRNVKGDTLVWRAGLPEWVKASELGELADILPIDITGQTAEPEEDNGWFAMIGNRRVGPSTITELIAAGATPSTPVWHQGMGDWANASTQREFNERFNSNTPPNFGQNFQFGQQPNYGHNQQYNQNGYRNNFGSNNNPYNNQPMRQNWMPWAIGATVVGFIFSCVGAIFGIIAIVQANKANGMYAAGFDAEADQVNNSAKTMTIIAYILAGVGLVFSGFLFRSGGIYSLF